MAEKAETTDLVRPTLIVGLGNPGDKYRQTRHNVGFEVVDALARHWCVSLTENRRFQGEFGEGRGPRGHKVYLLKPLTYMNRSGQSIRAVVDWFKLPPESVMVVYDDMDLPIGRLRMRLSGSAGGHNGMKSTITHLGVSSFPRLRLGIGATQKNDQDKDTAVVSHVLGKFSPEERRQIDQVIQISVEALNLSVLEGVAKAMSLYNGREAAAPC